MVTRAIIITNDKAHNNNIIIIMIIITKTIKIMKNYNHDGDKGHYNNK